MFNRSATVMSSLVFPTVAYQHLDPHSIRPHSHSLRECTLAAIRDCGVSVVPGCNASLLSLVESLIFGCGRYTSARIDV